VGDKRRGGGYQLVRILAKRSHKTLTADPSEAAYARKDRGQKKTVSGERVKKGRMGDSALFGVRFREG